MDGERRAVRQELEGLRDRLVEEYDAVESFCGRPGLNPQITEALSGLQYAVAKAAQDASRLCDDVALWEAD